jgi:photosystem II stability/assembly factor-like uncharacterized protein
MNNKTLIAFLMIGIVPLFAAMQNTFSADQALDYSPAATSKIVGADNSTSKKDAKPEAINIMLQSKDGGQTWQDISQGLPESEQPEDFFAGESDLYLRVKDVMYRSESNLNTPVWEKENGLDQRSNSIAFNRSGVMAYNYDGQIYQKISAAGNWLPIYSNFKRQLMRTIFETSNGTVFISSDRGLYKSTDNGRSWRQVKNEGWGMNIVESEGVLIATGQNGIMRSTDNGEHWEYVISEGGVGIAVERIDGGFAAISYNTTTKSRRIRISLDSGKTWKAIDDGLPASASISSIKQMNRYLICGHPDGIFRSSDMGKTWNMVHSSVGKNKFMLTKTFSADFTDSGKVFKLYVSGNSVYAVARYAGC